VLVRSVPVTVILLLGGSGSLGAQRPERGATIGLLATAATHVEAGRTTGHGRGAGIQLGLPLHAGWTLEPGVRYTRVRQTSVQADHPLWELRLGLGHAFGPLPARIRPSLEGGLGVEVGAVDRTGAVPSPDLINLTATFAAAASVPLLPRLSATLGAEASLPLLRYGRVSTGDWLRLRSEGALDRRTTGLLVGLNWEM